MNQIEHWQLLFQNNNVPCFVADIETKDILYYNETMEDILIPADEVVSLKFYDVIQNDNSMYSDWSQFKWDVEDVFRDKIYNKKLNQVFSAIFTLTEYKGKSYIFGKFTPVQTTKRFKFSFEEMMSQCITISQSDQEEKKTDILLQKLGEFYDAEKTYLYQIDRKNMRIYCLSSWCKDRNATMIENFEDEVQCKKMLDWVETRNEVGIVEAREEDVEKNRNVFNEEIINKLGLRNLVMSAIEDMDKMVYALIGITNRANLSVDFRLLQAVTGFVESDLSKTDVKVNLNQISAKDILTGVNSRIGYTQRLEEIHFAQPKKIGVLLTNLNGLKKINNEYGYAKGDNYLKKSAEALQRLVQEEVYRISGDEFVVFFNEIEKDVFEKEVKQLQEKIKEEENNCLAIGDAWGEGRYNIDALLKEAEAVMYINKQEYYSSAHIRFEDMEDSILSDLFRYLENEEFMIYVQPQVHLVDNSLYGAEALVRRFDKENQKMVFPDQFIPLYEKRSIIRHIDIFVVEAVCKLLAKWKENSQLIPISVNLSRVTLQEYGIARTLAKICDKYDVPRKYVVIEVTERVGLVENNVASSLITEFKEMGFKISLDDFGCAYSNIITLAQIEVDEVKIDKSLVDYVMTDKKNRILVKNVLAMCNELDGTSTLAEGVETKEQADLLYELGCHLGQGYVYSRPVPVAEFEEKYLIS